MTGSALVLWLAVVAAEGVALVMAVGRCSSSAPMSADLKKHSADPQKAKNALRPIVALLAFALAEDIAVRLLIDLVIAPAPRPLHGLARVAYHLADALVMAWPLALAWACWRVFVGQAGQVLGTPSSSPLHKHGGGWPGGRKQEPPQSSEAPHVSAGIGSETGASASAGVSLSSRPNSSFMGWSSRKPGAVDVLGATYAGSLLSLVTLHPLGATRTQWLLLAWEVVALAFAAVAIVLGWRRAVGGQVTWTVANGVLLVLVPVEAAVCAIGPFARPSVFSAWEVARWQYLAAFAIVAAMLGVRSRR